MSEYEYKCSKLMQLKYLNENIKNVMSNDDIIYCIACYCQSFKFSWEALNSVAL